MTCKSSKALKACQNTSYKQMLTRGVTQKTCKTSQLKLTVNSNRLFSFSETTLPPAAILPPAKRTSKSVSPYLEKSNSTLSRTCNSSGLRAAVYYKRQQDASTSKVTITCLYSRLKVFFKVIPFFRVLKYLHYSIRKGAGVKGYSDIPFPGLDLRTAAVSNKPYHAAC